MKLSMITKLRILLYKKLTNVQNKQEELCYYSGFRQNHKLNAKLELKISSYRLLLSAISVALGLTNILKSLKILIYK